MLGVALASGVAGGCGLVIDTSRKQCELVADCAEQLGDDVSIYECTDGLCRTKIECTANEQCAAEGKNICLQGQCVDCVITPDCPSATATCVDNVCVDEAWGCSNEPDNRPAATQSSASVNIMVKDAVSMMPVSGTTTAKLCLAATVDPTCAQSFAGSTASYSAQTGVITATGLVPGAYYRVYAVPPTSSGLLPFEYFTNRTARDVEMPADAYFTPSFILDGNALQAPKPIDRNKAIASFRIHDCLGRPAEGVSMTISGGSDDMIVTYTNETRQPNYELTATTKLGIAGVLNGPVGTLTTLTVKSGTKSVISFSLVFRGATSTTVDLYPRLFSAK